MSNSEQAVQVKTCGPIIMDDHQMKDCWQHIQT